MAQQAPKKKRGNGAAKKAVEMEDVASADNAAEASAQRVEVVDECCCGCCLCCTCCCKCCHVSRLYEIGLPVTPGPTRVALVNFASGQLKGKSLFDLFVQKLGADSVHRITAQNTPLAILENYRGTNNLQVIICGGDGTVGWVLDAVSRVHFTTTPTVGLVPSGSGNEMSRVLGWGKTYCGEPVDAMLALMDKARVIPLDRWLMSVRDGDQEVVGASVYSFFSIGWDARVAVDFHNFRQRRPCCAAACYKFWYTCFGFGAMCCQPRLRDYLDLHIDGREIPIPPHIESLVVICIPSYADNTILWRPDKSEPLQPQSISDGLVEVVGTSGPANYFNIKLGCTRAEHLGQGRDIFITLKPSFHGDANCPLAMQYDGEGFSKPWTEVNIKHSGHNFVLYQRPIRKCC